MLKIHAATAGVLAGALLLTGCSSSTSEQKTVPAKDSASKSPSPKPSKTKRSKGTPSPTPSPSVAPWETYTPTPRATTPRPTRVATQAPRPTHVATQAPAQEPAEVAPAQKAPTQEAPAQSSVYYKNCAEARAAGAAPIHRGEPGYRAELDRDDDGIACEWTGKKKK